MFKKFLSLLLTVMMVVSMMAVGVVTSTTATTERFTPTEAPPVPTEVPLMPTEPDLPHDIYLNVDGYLYEVWAGSDHTYSYYLSNAGTICGIDAVITWDAPFITMVGDPSFPILGQEADLENPGFSGNVVSAYSNDEYGNINMLRFNYTHAEGADFSDDKAEVVTFTIHIDENTPAGIFYINTYVKTLEGEEEEKQVFEGTDTIEPPVIRNGEIDGHPGEMLITDYTADEQTYATYSEEEKTFTVSDYDHYYDDTSNKFRSLYIDNGYGYYTLVPYNYYTKENEFGSLKLTLKPEYLDTISVGDYYLKFVFSDGEAYGVLHILQGSPATPDEPVPIDPYDPDKVPYVGGNTINFYSPSAGWDVNDTVQFYVYEVSTGQELISWGSRKLDGTYVGNGIWSYDPSNMNLVTGIQYAIIFVNKWSRAQTYELLLDTSCLGDTAYCTGRSVENPVDCYKTYKEAKWKNHSDLGPRLQITSIGNVIGETCPRHTTPYAIFVQFLKHTLDNARQYLGKSDQQLLDDIARRLNLSSEDVNKAIAEAGVRVDWTPPYVPPTEPPTDSYGYIPGEYYLTGSINGDNSGTANVHKGLRFKDYSSDSMILEGVRLKQGDVVRAARYNGKNTFTVYPDGVGRDVSITQSGRYDFYFKPYELGNGNYWYITPSYLGTIEPYLLGDADGNGELSSADAAYILRYLAKIDTPYTKSELMRGDVDDSGDLELTDATTIQYYLANMNTPYPIGTTIG